MGNTKKSHLREEDYTILSNIRIFIKNDKIKVKLSQEILSKENNSIQKGILKQVEYTVGIHFK